jgi:hypothetical protein
VAISKKEISSVKRTVTQRIVTLAYVNNKTARRRLASKQDLGIDLVEAG